MAGKKLKDLEPSTTDWSPIVGGSVPIQRIDPHVPMLTMERYFGGRRSNPLVGAFVHVQKLKSSTQKRSAEEWEAEFKAFCSAERR